MALHLLNFSSWLLKQDFIISFSFLKLTCTRALNTMWFVYHCTLVWMIWFHVRCMLLKRSGKRYCSDFVPPNHNRIHFSKRLGSQFEPSQFIELYFAAYGLKKKVRQWVMECEMSILSECFLWWFCFIWHSWFNMVAVSFQVKVFIQPHYLQNFVQSTFNALTAEKVRGAILLFNFTTYRICVRFLSFLLGLWVKSLCFCTWIFVVWILK